MNPLRKSIQRQIEVNRAKNLLFAHVEQIIEIEPTFLAALEELVGNCEQPDLPSLDDVVSFASRTLVQRLYAINQFVQVDRKKLKKLESIYRHTWTQILKTRDIQTALRASHYPALSQWIADLYPDDFRHALKSVPLVGHVVCEEYSPQLQIDLLRIDLQTIRPPVIDVGCGSTARLVRYLRTLDIEAWGIDRYIEKRESYLWVGDWLDYTFEPGKWGAVISNMAFTNHLVYALQHDDTRLELYLIKFAEIIESLAVGSSFYYAPSVPFVEHRLGSTKYQVERIPIIDETCVSRITRIAR